MGRRTPKASARNCRMNIRRHSHSWESVWDTRCRAEQAGRKTAAEAWRATRPFENPDAPASPFDMPQYALPERIDADRWEQIAQDESAAADNTGAMSNRYLLFTIIYASVLFLAGISGKFRWQAIDLTVLVLGAVTLVAGVAIMIALPRV